jgi:hypothetical protein
MVVKDRPLSMQLCTLCRGRNMFLFLKKMVQLRDLKVRSQFIEKMVRDVLELCGDTEDLFVFRCRHFKIEYPCMVIDCSELQFQVFF